MLHPYRMESYLIPSVSILLNFFIFFISYSRKLSAALEYRFGFYCRLLTKTLLIIQEDEQQVFISAKLLKVASALTRILLKHCKLTLLYNEKHENETQDMSRVSEE